MSSPLSENPRHLQHLCTALDMGRPAKALSVVTGGYHHRMWRLEATCGMYAIKQLSIDADVNDAATIEHYNVTETIAETFACHGIPAAVALKNEHGYLQVLDSEGYLVYPWAGGSALDIFEISAQHALRIAQIIAAMHRADISVPGVHRLQFDVHSEENIVQLVELSEAYNHRVAETLRDELPRLLTIVEHHSPAVRKLNSQLVISHGDLDQKNVLWDAEKNPVLIDWESSRKLNPTYEIVLESLNWSGIGARFDRELFWKILSSYREAGGIIERESVEASFHCVLGDWVNWLMYNVGRSFDPDDAEQRRIGTQQVDLALSTLHRLRTELPDLLPK